MKLRTTLLGFVCLLAVPATASAAPTWQQILTEVTQADGYRYGARDHQGRSMDALKVVKDSTAYYGVYHTWDGAKFNVHLASSFNLRDWTHRATLAKSASQPSIARAGTKWFVAYESHASCAGAGNCLGVKRYANRAALVAGSADGIRLLPRTLSSCAEGTPSIFSATSTRLDIGFHYFANCAEDRQARGTLGANLAPATWAPARSTAVDSSIIAAGAHPDGNVRDRDGVWYPPASTFKRVYDGQVCPRLPESTSRACWRPFAWEGGVATRLQPRTHGGSATFSSPATTSTTLPDGRQGLVVTYFIPGSGAAPGESGSLIYWRAYDPPPPGASDPVVAAAGDVACSPANTTSLCHAAGTSDLLVAGGYSAVLPLGDLQYEDGRYSNFTSPDPKSYNSTWGRVQSISRPVPGNHEYQADPAEGDCGGVTGGGACGYFDYFNGIDVFSGRAGDRDRGYYSFDLGQWHLIALNTGGGACVAGGMPGSGPRCDAGSPQDRWLESDLAATTKTCILAYWHHPRWTPTGSYGDFPEVAELWRTLYDGGNPPNPSKRAEVVLAGHEHIYARSQRIARDSEASDSGGMQAFIVGTGGKNFDTANILSGPWRYTQNTQFGVLRLTLHPASYAWQFVAENGSVLDSGSGTCHT